MFASSTVARTRCEPSAAPAGDGSAHRLRNPAARIARRQVVRKLRAAVRPRVRMKAARARETSSACVDEAEAYRRLRIWRLASTHTRLQILAAAPVPAGVLDHFSERQLPIPLRNARPPQRPLRAAGEPAWWRRLDDHELIAQCAMKPIRRMSNG